jgi:hypothetical protein
MKVIPYNIRLRFKQQTKRYVSWTEFSERTSLSEVDVLQHCGPATRFSRVINRHKGRSGIKYHKEHIWETCTPKWTAALNFSRLKKSSRRHSLVKNVSFHLTGEAVTTSIYVRGRHGWGVTSPRAEQTPSAAGQDVAGHADNKEP